MITPEKNGDQIIRASVEMKQALSAPNDSGIGTKIYGSQNSYDCVNL